MFPPHWRWIIILNYIHVIAFCSRFFSFFALFCEVTFADILIAFSLSRMDVSCTLCGALEISSYKLIFWYNYCNIVVKLYWKMELKSNYSFNFRQQFVNDVRWEISGAEVQNNKKILNSSKKIWKVFKFSSQNQSRLNTRTPF